MAKCKGYFIFGKALKVYSDSAYWCSQGDIFTNYAAGSILIARLGGAVFESEQAARKIMVWSSCENGSTKGEPTKIPGLVGSPLDRIGDIQATDLRNRTMGVAI